MFVLLVFFFKQKTAYEMRISDWSSDVCSSDLISDDGHGIDTGRLVDKAIAAGRLTPEAAARMSEAEKLDLIFHPGLSTANQVTAISGRGVGMDVVRANVERIGGVIGLDNRHGSGLTLARESVVKGKGVSGNVENAGIR